jgi:hypothetical protein
LQAAGFRACSSYYRAKIPNAKRFVKVLNSWTEQGFDYVPKFLKSGAQKWFAEMYKRLNEGVPEIQAGIRASASAKIPNFYALTHVAQSEKKLITPYPVLEDGVAYLALPRGDGQPGSRYAMKKTKNLLEWETADSRMIRFGTIKEIKETAKSLKAAGVTVTNAGSLNRKFRTVRNLKVRNL